MRPAALQNRIIPAANTQAFMIGTIANVCTIIIGSVAGSLARRGIKEKYRSALFNALGLACLVLGANTAIKYMPQSEYPVLFIASLLHAPMEALLKGIAYFFGAAAYFCEIVLLTDCFTAKVPHKELFMAYCFGPMYILLGLSYLLGH